VSGGAAILRRSCPSEYWRNRNQAGNSLCFEVSDEATQR
jgi:hypothetical protein